jgi:hypothetical protein
MLDWKVRGKRKDYPSEDLRSRKIKYGVHLRDIQKTWEYDGCAKVVYGRPYRSRTCDTLIKSPISALLKLNPRPEALFNTLI